jgi:O-antigen ligase
VMFCLEGLHRTWYLGLTLGVLLAAGGLAVAFADKLPIPLQRSLSFLPIKVDPLARQDAQGSLDWRMDMWQEVSKEVRPNLFLGKGYAIEASALQFANWNSHLNYAPQWEWAALTAEYHNGPLSVLVPFGIWGGVAFVWFLVATGLRLRWHYRNCPPESLSVNRLLFAMFIVQTLFFIFLFGSLYSGLIRFVFIIGLAECLNAPEAKPAPEEQEPEPAPEMAFERGETL